MMPRLLLHPAIRRKAALDRVPLDRFCIRVARTTAEYEEAFRLVHVSYVFEGIEPLKPIDLRMTEQHVLREAIVLCAYEDEQLVGTITVTGDSPAGLPLDADYRGPLTALREQGARVAEVGSFAVVRRCQRSGLAQLLSMAATRVAFRTLDATHAVVGIHPKAAPVYRALWAFDELGGAQRHAQLRAPVIGLVAERNKVLRHVGRCFPKQMPTGHRASEHLLEGPPLPCVSMPDDSPQSDLQRYRMPRGVFQELFLRRSDRLSSLSEGTWRHLRRQRTDETLTCIRGGRSPRPELQLVTKAS